MKSFSDYHIDEAKINLKGHTISQLIGEVLNFKGKTLIYFDTETMGFDPREEFYQLTEIAAIAYSGNTFKTLKTYNYKVKLSNATKRSMVKGTPENLAFTKNLNPGPGHIMKPEDILRKTRYGEKTAPFIHEAHVLNKMLKFIGQFKNPILVAHNMTFDMRFIKTRASRYGIKIPDYQTLDTLDLAKRYFIPMMEKAKDSAEMQIILKDITGENWRGEIKPSAKLGVLAKALKINASGWHNALADVEMMVGVTKKMLNLLKKYQNVDIIDMKNKKVKKKINETYSAVGVKGIETQKLATVYVWLKWGNAAKTGLSEKDPKWKKSRDIIGAELGKRARNGEEAAKRALNNRMTKDVDKYGKKIVIQKSTPKPTLLQKILKALKQ